MYVFVVIIVVKQVSFCLNVYTLASMDVKINHTVSGQNQEIFQNAYLTVMPVETWATSKDIQRRNCENLCFCPSKLNGIYRKWNKLEFGCKFCRICHLGRLAAIIIDILSHAISRTQPQNTTLPFSELRIRPWCLFLIYLSHDTRKPVFGSLLPGKTQTGLFSYRD